MDLCRYGRLIEGPATTGELSATVTDLSTSTSRTTVDVAGSRLLALPVPLGAGQRAVVVVVEDLSPYEQAERYALILSLVLGSVLVLGSAGVASWSVHLALHPVAVMADRARDWSEHDLDRRFDLGPGKDEITARARPWTVCSRG